MLVRLGRRPGVTARVDDRNGVEARERVLVVVDGRLFLRLLLDTVELEEHDGDVVLAAASIGGVHERVRCAVEVVAALQEREDLAVGDHVCQPVGAEEEEVAGLGGIVSTSTSTSGSVPTARVITERWGCISASSGES